MDNKIMALAAALGGLVVGVAGASAFAHSHAAPTGIACAVGDSAADAKADAIVKQLHAHDHDAYTPHPAPPVGELPKP